MADLGGLYVGELEIARITGLFPINLLSMFTDDMYRLRSPSASDHVDTKLFKTIHEFAAPGQVIADRMDVLGFTPTRVREYLDSELRGLKSLFSSLASDFPLDTEDYIAELRSAVSRGGANRPSQGIFSSLMSRITTSSIELALRAALIARPDDETRLDLTPLSFDQVLTMRFGEFVKFSNLCSLELRNIRNTTTAHAPVVVLAEGKSDITVLQPALELFYPHLTDLVRFMDYGERPMGGAGALVNTVRSFAAAGIANRIVALFDNDTAAADALRTLVIPRLPANIRVRQYPPLDLARDYPTLGPSPRDTVIANTDVNGLAGSIELYLGSDVLTGPDGALRPVHWGNYIPSMRQYQGEIANKGDIHKAYQVKLRRAKTDRSHIANQDWSGVRAILDLILRAFDDSTWGSVRGVRMAPPPLI